MMKKNNRIRYRLCALALSLVLLAAVVPVVQVSADGEDIIHITSAEEFAQFARSCTLDSWSRGKTVSLDADLTLEGADYLPVPTFGGTFRGNGHTVSAVAITESLSPAGLFGVLQEGGSITDLNVTGAVTPAGDSMNSGGIVGENHGSITNCAFTGSVSGKRSVGSIAGENAATGVICACTSAGAVFGENMTGGIVGCNLGSVLTCRNGAYVNIESVDPAIDLENLNLSFTLDLSKLSQLDTAGVATDTGGVAGYSSGIIAECVNAAAVGYQHIGYNVGGIAGRSCGQIRACRNESAVCGRKDVGGIVGQMEPYIRMEVSESLLQKLEAQLDELSGLVNTVANHAEGGSNEIASRLNSMSGYVDNAADELNNVRLNASVDSVITGDASHASDTVLGGGKGAAAGVDHEHSDSGHSTTIWGGSAAGAGVSHEGDASGVITGSTQIVAAPDLGGLTSSINGLSSQVTMLNSAANGTVGALTNDIRAINSKFNEISDTVLEAVANSGSSDIISDTSSVDIDSVTLGKVSGSNNTGEVYGDINTGGIAGSMAIEYALDPEDDVTAHISDSYRRQYEYKSIIQKCTNTGTVTGKRSYVGGVCGRMDLGLITDCEGYGTVTSENGSYVGGIAGLTGAVVRSSYAKCTLGGKKYVGGIVGSGVAEKASGSASNVAGCYSLVEITDCQQYSGAISGSDTGTFLENYYVSDTLAGINRQGYSGRAEPIGYDALLAVEGLPESMKQFTLRFVADGETVLERSFTYGASFSESDIPAPPEKDGYYVHWDKADLSSLHFDTTVSAVYDAYTPALSSAQQREDGRTVFLVEGQYTGGDTMQVSSEAPTPSAFNILSGTFGDKLEQYFSCFSHGRLPQTVVDRDVLEQWSLTFADDGQSTHTVRYLAPDGKTDALRIYVRPNGGAWESVDYDKVGSYLTFPVQGGSAEIAAVSTLSVWWIWLVLALAVLLIVFLILHLVRRSRRARRAHAGSPVPPADIISEAEQIVREAEAPAAPIPEDVPAAVSVSTAARAAVPAAGEAADERLRRVEEELRAMRAEREAAPQQKQRRAKKRSRLLALLLALLILAAAAVVFFLHSDLGKDVEAYLLIESRMKEDPLAMDVTVDASLNGAQVSTNATAVRTASSDGTTITCVQMDGVTLYCANGAVYLENGRSYAIGGVCGDYSELLSKTAALCRALEITKSVDGNSKLYRFTAAGADADTLVRLLVPAALADAAAVQSLSVELRAEGGELMSLRFTDSGALTLDARVDFLHSVKAPEIPDDVLHAIANGTADSTVLTEDTLRLINAISSFAAQDELSADLTLSADCGSIVLSDTAQYDQRAIDGQSYGCIRSGTFSFYFSGSRICDADGNSIDASGASLVDSSQLIALSYGLIMNGTAECVRSGSGYLYTLSLDEDGMSALAAAIAPDIKTQSVSFTSGSIEVSVTGEGAVRQIGISCSGALHLILTDAPASLSAVIQPVTREFSFPQPALNALKP